MTDIKKHIASLKAQLKSAIADGDFPMVVSLYNRLETAKNMALEGAEHGS